MVRAAGVKVLWLENLFGVRFSDRVRTSFLYGFFGTHDLAAILRYRRLRTAGHILRYPDGRWAKEIITSFPTGSSFKRKVWTWNTRIKNDAKLCGIKIAQLCEKDKVEVKRHVA